MDGFFEKLQIGDYLASEQDGIDYIRNDGRVGVEIKSALAGRRGLYSTGMQMAMYLADNPEIERICLVLFAPRISLSRLKEEWEKMQKLFARSSSKRIALVVFDDDEIWCSPNDTLNREIAETFASLMPSEQNNHDLIFTAKPRPRQKFYEVLKILLVHWLQHDKPIALGRLAKQAGCSYPTVKEALQRKSLSNSVTFTSNRSVSLKTFPHDAWRELVAMSAEVRKTFRFSDRTGGKLDAEDMLRRIRKLNKPRLGIGGVVAARHWHPDFDLNGTPRIDLCYYTLSGEVDLRFVKKLDPALTLTEDPDVSPSLVIHTLVRGITLFSKIDTDNLPYADPVETVLDLCDLKLMAQASQLVNYLRPEARL